MEEYLDESLGLETVINNYNKLGMDKLNSGDFPVSVQYLQRALDILNIRSLSLKEIKLKAMTLNNLGCLCKRLQQYPRALAFLTEALELECQLDNDPQSIAATHLNICAIRSQIGQHEAALAHAKRALSTLKSINISGSGHTMLVIAYNNAANQKEFLGDLKEASELYYDGWQYAVEFLGRSHELSSLMFESCTQVTVKTKKLPKIHKKYRPTQKLVASPLLRTIGLKENAITTKYRRVELPIPTKKRMSRISSTQRANSPVHFDSQIHFIQDKLVSESDEFTEVRGKSRENLAFFSRRRQEAAKKIQGYWKTAFAKLKLKKYIRSAKTLQLFARYAIGIKEFSNFKQSVHECSLGIQTAFRGWICRTEITELKMCVRIQTRFRGWKVYKKTKKLMRCIRIQKAFKQYKSFKKKEKIRSCFNIQKWFKTGLKRIWKKKNTNSRLIQMRFKMIEAYKLKLKTKDQVILIQTWMRAILAKLTRADTFTVKSNISLIGQRLFRGNRGRNSFVLYRTKVNQYSLIIQNLLRKVILKNVYEETHKEKTKGQIIIEKWYKGWKARKFYKDFLEKIHRFSMLSQIKFKQFLSKDFYDELYKNRSWGALVIQKHRRRCQDTQKFKNYKHRVDNASTAIQSKTKQFIMNNEYRCLYKLTDGASLIIQTHYRRKKASEFFKQFKYNVNKNCTLIQTAFRSWIDFSFYTKTKIEKNSASVHVQKIFRSYTIKKKVSMYKENVYHNIQKIVSVFRAFLKYQEYKKLKYFYDSAALLIQNNFRAFYLNKKYKLMRENAIQIQALYRGHRARVHCNQLRSFLDEVDIIYLSSSSSRGSPKQSFLRNASYRNNLYKKPSVYAGTSLYKRNTGNQNTIPNTEQSFKRKIQFEKIDSPENSIIIDQSPKQIKRDSFQMSRQPLIGKMNAEKLPLPPMNTKNTSSIDEKSINYPKEPQTNFEEGMHCQDHDHICMDCFREILNNPAVDFSQQISYESLNEETTLNFLLQRNPNHKESMLPKLTKAQSLIRGFIARKLYKKEVNQLLKRKAALKIQSYMRKYMCRKRYRKLIGILRIQTAFRAFIERDNTEYLKKVIKCQSFIKMALQLNQYKRLVTTIKVQAHYRGYIQRKRYRELLAARLIQRNVRYYFLKKKIWHKKCVIKLQALARGIYARKQYRILKKLIIIQKAFRKYSSAVESRTLRNILNIQKTIRKSIAYKETHLLVVSRRIYFPIRSYLMKKKCLFSLSIKRIQVVYRSFLSKSIAKKKLIHSKIQAVFLSHNAKESVKRLRQNLNRAAQNIQARYHSFIARLIFSEVLDMKNREKAATSLQAMYRGHKSRSLYQDALNERNRHRAAEFIQKIFRAKKARKLFSKALEARKRIKAASFIQSWFKAHSTRMLFLEVREAAIVIQRWYRRTRLRASFRYLYRATIFIQNYWRMYLIRRHDARKRMLIERGQYQSQKLW